MREIITSRHHLRQPAAILLSIGLWTMLWLSISPGNPADILNPGSPMAFAQGLRAAFPLIAAGVAAIVVGVKVFRASPRTVRVKVIQGNPRTIGAFGPLGLATAYGLAGLAASLKSPDGSVALWWASLYLSVPIVLWGVVWGDHALDHLGRLLNQTWIIAILAVMILLVVAVLYLDLVDKTLSPSRLLQCQPVGWLDLTGGRIRGTGVGRYAAIAALIAISRLWQGRWRPMWIVVLLTSLTMLLYTGARGSFGGFAAGSSLIVLIYLVYAGKRALLLALLSLVVLIPLVLSTGIYESFVEKCVFRGFSNPAAVVPAPSADIAGTSDTPAPDPTASVVVPALPDPTTAALEKTVQPAASVVVPALPDPTTAALEKTVQPAASVVVPALPDPTAPPMVLAVDPESAVSGLSPIIPNHETDQVETRLITKDFFKFTGRMRVWVAGWKLVKSSPLIGFGFHADRLLLGTHMHNSVMHALLQAGFIGAIPFVAAMTFAWFLFFRIVRTAALLPRNHKHLVIQCGGVLAFLTMRSFPESTGAFFGVDWLILAPVLFYLEVVNYGRQSLEVNGDSRILERA